MQLRGQTGLVEGGRISHAMGTVGYRERSQFPHVVARVLPHRAACTDVRAVDRCFVTDLRQQVLADLRGKTANGVIVRSPFAVFPFPRFLSMAVHEQFSPGLRELPIEAAT